MTGATPILVETPPPPARPEQITAAPAKDCLWVEGHWLWRERQWQWLAGSWIRLQEPCFYADSVAVWVPTLDGKESEGTGALFYTAGEWYKADGSALCTSIQQCATATPQNTATPTHATPTHVTPTNTATQAQAASPNPK